MASSLPTLLATIRQGLLEEVPSDQRSALVMGTDEDGHRGYMLITHDELPRADVLAVRARRVALDDGRKWWASFSYVLDSDGYWRCTLPWRRAMDRLAAMNLRRALVMWRLLMGQDVTMAWRDVGEPSERDALAIARTVLTFADQETSAQLEHRPRDEGRCPCQRCRSERKERAEERRRSIVATLERSQAQLDAEAAVA